MSNSPPSRPVVGVGAVVWRGDEILLVRRGRPPAQGSWTLPGGKQHLGETVAEAAAREVREEAGIEIAVGEVVGVADLIHRAPGGGISHHYTVVDVTAEWVAGEAVAGDDADAVAWVRPEGLDSFGVLPDVKRMVAAAKARRPGKKK